VSEFEEDSLVKSRQRIEDHGEVFTPSWLVEGMLNLVKDESERIDSRFLEITADEWDIAALLPAENFVGATTSKVYYDSRKKF
jgi:hypothetical protein